MNRTAQLRKELVLLVFACGLFATTGFSATLGPLEQGIDPRGSVDPITSFELLGQTGGSILVSTILRGISYVGLGPRLVVLETDPTDGMVMAGRSPVLPGLIEDIDLVNPYAHVVTSSGSYHIIDISNIHTPKVVGSLEIAGATLGVRVIGNYAFVTDGNRGIYTVDISISSEPNIVGLMQFEPGVVPKAITIEGKYAYVVDGVGLHVIDLTNPMQLVRLGYIRTPGYAYDLYLVENYVYIADGDGISVVDVSDPYTPALIKNERLNGTLVSVYAANDVLFVAAKQSGVHMVDIGMRTQPKLLKTLVMPGPALHVIGVEDKLQISLGASGLSVWSVADSARPSEISRYGATADVWGLDFMYGKVYIADTSGLRIIDVSNRTNPRLTSITQTEGQARDVAVFPHDAKVMAIIADGQRGLTVVEVPSAGRPIIKETFPLPGFANSIVIANRLAFVASGNSGLAVVDFSVPHQPDYLASIDTAGYANDVVISGQRVYVADGNNGVCSVDVSIPAQPQLLDCVRSSESPVYVEGVWAEGDQVFTANAYQQTVHIWDFSHVHSPRLVAEYETPGYAYDVMVEDGIAYIPNATRGLFVLDVVRPNSIQNFGTYDTPGVARRVYSHNHDLFILDADGGLSVVRHNVPDQIYLPFQGWAKRNTLTAPVIPSGSFQSQSLSYDLGWSQGFPVLIVT